MNRKRALLLVAGIALVCISFYGLLQLPHTLQITKLRVNGRADRATARIGGSAHLEAELVNTGEAVNGFNAKVTVKRKGLFGFIKSKSFELRYPYTLERGETLSIDRDVHVPRQVNFMGINYKLENGWYEVKIDITSNGFHHSSRSINIYLKNKE